MSDRKYAGITIGPILQTLDGAGTPAALWFASSYFSDLTRRLCQALTEQVEDIQIYSPYYSETTENDDGVGRYHDRIIFSASSLEAVKLQGIIKRVKEASLEDFIYDERDKENENYMDAKAFLEQYLQIHFIIMPEEEIEQNSLLTLSPYLDTLELMKTFPVDENGNPFKKLFEEDKNAGLKKSMLFKRIDRCNNQFINKKGNIRSIAEISSCSNSISKELKRRHYFAVVQADGDNMGKILETLKDDKVQIFSKTCLDYAEEASKLVGSFGGMTIYAGGDDLLFLAPVANNQGKTVFELCKEISTLFEMKMQKDFANLVSFPTVSFGVSIQYEKFPLYEALDNARRLLFNVAKRHCYSGEEKPAKNSMAIGVQKHSGQTMEIILDNLQTDILKKLFSLDTERKDGEQVVTSVLFTIETYQFLLKVLNKEAREGKIEKEAYEKAWMNLFDNMNQKPAEAYIRRICDIWYQDILMCNNRIDTADVYSKSKDMSVMVNLLRIKKFFEERG